MSTQSKHTLYNKIKNRKGMSLTELLCVTLILALVSAGLAMGISLAVRQYRSSVLFSEAEELYSTIEQILTNELRYTSQIEVNPSNRVQKLYSVTYAVRDELTALVALDDEGNETTYGELAFGSGGEYNRILGRKSYADGLQASATIIYTAGSGTKDGYFTVNLVIAVNGEPYLQDQQFQVRALNLKTVN